MTKPYPYGNKGCIAVCGIGGPACEEEEVDKTWLLDIGGCEPAGVEYLGVLKQGGQVIKSIPLLPGQVATMHNVPAGTYWAGFVYRLPDGQGGWSDWQVLGNCSKTEEIGPGQPNENYCEFTWPCYHKRWILTIEGDCEPDNVSYRGVLVDSQGQPMTVSIPQGGGTAHMWNVPEGWYDWAFEYSLDGGATWQTLDACSGHEYMPPDKTPTRHLANPCHKTNRCTYEWPCYEKMWLLTITGGCVPAGVQYRGVLYSGRRGKVRDRADARYDSHHAQRAARDLPGDL